MRLRSGFVSVAHWILSRRVTLCAPSVNLGDPLSLGSCICDLTQAQCDVNCCCDPDCQGLSDGFSCLPEGPRSATSQYCYSKSWLHSVNPRVDLWVISDDLRGLLCVSVDNSAVQGEVFQNQALLSSSQIDAIIQEQSTPTTVATGDSAPRGYRAGDILKVNSALSADQTVQLIQGASTLQNANLQVVRSLSVPTAADPYGTCASAGQVRFLTEVPASACWTEVNLTSQCTTSLNPRQLLQTWMLRQQYMPEDMQCGDLCLLPTTCLIRSTAADGTVVSVQDCNGNATVADSSFDDASCTCTGAVQNMHFQFYFGLVSEVVSITRVHVNYTIQDISSKGCGLLRIQQGGSVAFLQDESGGQQIEARSGNPGYVTGLPLLVADCTLVDGSCTSYGARQDATVPGILPGGKCALNASNTVQEVQEVKINFGENAIFGCTLDLTREELKSLCGGDKALQNGFVGHLKMLPFGSPSWSQIASFGSVPNGAQDAADFVQVEENPRTAMLTETLKFSDSDAGKASTSTCTGAVVGVELEVIYSSFGQLGNPQMKVVGARMSHVPGALAYTLADATKKQSFEFTYKVRFTHTDADALEVKVPPRPQLPLSLPPDLFYPFTLGSAGKRSIPTIAIALIALQVLVAGVG